MFWGSASPAQWYLQRFEYESNGLLVRLGHVLACESNVKANPQWHWLSRSFGTTKRHSHRAGLLVLCGRPFWVDTERNLLSGKRWADGHHADDQFRSPKPTSFTSPMFRRCGPRKTDEQDEQRPWSHGRQLTAVHSGTGTTTEVNSTLNSPGCPVVSASVTCQT